MARQKGRQPPETAAVGRPREDPLGSLLQELGRSPSCQRLVDALVPQIADVAAVVLRAADRLDIVAFRHVDPSRHALLAEFQHLHHPSIDDPLSVGAQVVRTGQPLLLSSITDADVRRFQNARVRALFQILAPSNIVAVPLEDAAGRYGALIAAMAGSSRSLIYDDLEFLTELGRRVGPIVARP